MVDVSYGGENGFNQAIELAAESLQNVKFIQEKKLIGKSFWIPNRGIPFFQGQGFFFRCHYVQFSYTQDGILTRSVRILGSTVSE